MKRAHGARRAPGRAPGWTPFAVAGVAAGLLFLASLRNWGAGAGDVPYLGAALAFLAVLPALAWSGWRRRAPEAAGAVPFLPVIGVLFAVYYGVPVLLEDEFTTPTLRETTPSLVRALGLAFLGWFALLLGWWFARPWSLRVRPLVLELEPARSRAALPWLLGIGVAALLLPRFVDLSPGLVQPVRFLQLFYQVAVGFLVLESFRGRLHGALSAATWLVLVPAFLFLQIGSGSVAQLAYAGLFLCFLAWGEGRRVPLAALCVGGLLLLLLRGHVHAFRSQTWQEHAPASEAGPWQRSALFLDMVVERFRSDPEEAWNDSVEQVTARTAHLATFAHVVELTPRSVPYWDGATYTALTHTLVPRLFWPSKPSKEVGQEFGHRYRLLAPNDRTTSVNLPQLIEMYANFGRTGVVLGSLLLGVLYRLLHRWWNQPGSGTGTLVLASILFSRLILIESDFSLVFGAVLQQTVLLVLVFRWLGPRRGEKRGLRPDPALGGAA